MAASKKVVTGKVRLSYVFLTEPRSAFEGQEPKYSCVILIPKSDTATLDKIRGAQRIALEEGKSKLFNGSIPKNWKNTLHDGDEEADLEKNPEYEGHYYMSISSSAKYKPGVVDRNLNPILDPTEIYSGMYARVSMGAFPFNTQGSKGVSFGLNHVQKLEDGEPLGGTSRAEDDFDALDEDDEDGLL